MIINVINVDDLTSGDFLERLAEKVAEKISAKASADSEEFLTDAEIAKLIGCSVTTVWRKKKSGKIGSVQVGGVRRVRKCDLLGGKE